MKAPAKFNHWVLLLLFLPIIGWAQKIEFQPSNVDLGTFSEAGSIRFKVVIKNTGLKNLFILRADSPPKTDVYISKKIILPADTALATFIYHPQVTGPFKHTANFITNSGNTSDALVFSGSVGRLLSDNLLHCVDFKPKETGSMAAIPVFTMHRSYLSDAISGLPINFAEITYIDMNGAVNTLSKRTEKGLFENTIPVGMYAIVVKSPGYEPLMMEQFIGTRSTSQNYMLVKQKETITPAIKDSIIKSDEKIDTLDNLKFKPNNLVFLIDASGSMKDQNKLPLLITSMRRLIEPLRSTDRVSIVVYAAQVEIKAETQPGNNKAVLINALDQLKAEGITAGSAGLEQAYKLIEKGYIVDGNNQIILATDGVFRISAAHRKTVEHQAQSLEKPIVLSVVALGEDEAALNMLKKLSQTGKGSFLHLQKESPGAVDALLNEITLRSRR
jgi:Mg-chelatase subunit ChlD